MCVHRSMGLFTPSAAVSTHAILTTARSIGIENDDLRGVRVSRGYSAGLACVLFSQPVVAWVPHSRDAAVPAVAADVPRAYHGCQALHICAELARCSLLIADCCSLRAPCSLLRAPLPSVEQAAIKHLVTATYCADSQQLRWCCQG